MSKDYYKILGVEKSANESELKKAFYKKAAEHHPDKKTGDEAKFKEVNEAYQTLSDKQKRAQYDQFGSAGPQGGFGGGHGGFHGFDFSQGFGGQGGIEFDMGDMEDIFSQFGFGFGGGRGGGQRMRRGRNYETVIQLTFAEAVYGATKKITLPDGKKEKEVTITIPPGSQRGTRLKVTGYGEQVEGGKAGDLYIIIDMIEDKVYRFEGKHIATDITLKLSEALLGVKKTLTGPDDKKFDITIPPGITHGQMVRVKGKGVPGGNWGTGDLLVYVAIDMPTKLSKKAKEAIEELQKEGL